MKDDHKNEDPKYKDNPKNEDNPKNDDEDCLWHKLPSKGWSHTGEVCVALHNFFKALFLLHALEATWRENVKCVGFAPVGRVHVDMHLTTILPIAKLSLNFNFNFGWG